MIKAHTNWNKCDLISTSTETSALPLLTISGTVQCHQLPELSWSFIYLSVPFVSHNRLITLDSWRMAPSSRDTSLLTSTGSSQEDLFSSTPATKETSPGSATIP